MATRSKHRIKETPKDFRISLNARTQQPAVKSRSLFSQASRILGSVEIYACESRPQNGGPFKGDYAITDIPDKTTNILFWVQQLYARFLNAAGKPVERPIAREGVVCWLKHDSDGNPLLHAEMEISDAADTTDWNITVIFLVLFLGD